MLGREFNLKAVVKTKRGVGNIELLEVEEPDKIGPDELLLEIKATGICGTDIHIWHDQSVYVPPVILGHEYSGVVTQIGEKVENVNIGDLVTSPATVNCGVCYFCKTGHTNRCISAKKRILGVMGANGAFAKYMVVPARIIHKVPIEVNFEDAAVSEPTACAVHAAAEMGKIDLGDIVVIQGPGPMGLLTLQVVKAQGANQTIVTGISGDEERLKIAKELGADVTVNIEEEDPVEIVGSLTNDLGADVVFEASGAVAARRQAFDLVKRTGKIIYIGITGKPSEIDLDQIVEKELKIIGSWGTVWTSWRKALKLIASGKVKGAPLVTSKMSLEEWEKGFQMMEEKKAIKVLLIP